MASVCAVFPPSDRLERGLAAQQVAPRFSVEQTGALGEALRRGLATGAEWIWILDGSAAPRPDALAALLGALDRAGGLPAPVLVAGVVLTPDGRLDEGRAAWSRRRVTQVAMAAAERRLHPIRVATAPLMVHRAAVEGVPGPRRGLSPLGALLEWTARLLRGEAGYLVPESRHGAAVETPAPARSPRTAAALLLGDGLSGLERLKLVADLAEGATVGLKRPPGRGRRAAPARGSTGSPGGSD